MKRTSKILLKSVRSLTFRKVIRLFSSTLPHPLFTILSLLATYKAFILADKYFPGKHTNNGLGNAFRHALWTSLILLYCTKITSPNKALIWCKKITDLYEDLFQNPSLERKMDLHNNQVGMDLYMELLPSIHRQFFEPQFLVDEILKKIPSAEKINHINDNFSGNLIYIEA